MKVKNILLYTTCALALLRTCNMAYAMEDSEKSESVSRVKSPRVADSQLEEEARAHATQLGIPIQADAQITVDLATGYRTASQVHRYYTTVLSVLPSSGGIAAPDVGTWNELVNDAAQGKYSPFFRSVMKTVGGTEKYGDIPLAGFSDIARAHKSHLTSAKHFTPQETAEHLNNFLNKLAVSQGFLSAKLALDGFVVGLPAQLPAAFAEELMGEERAAVKLPEDLNDLKRFIGKKASFSQHMLSLVEFFNELAAAPDLQAELGVLSRYISFASLVQEKHTPEQVASTVRDYVYATFLQQEEGKNAGEVWTSKQSLLQHAGFKALTEVTKEEIPFTGLNMTHDMPLSELLSKSREKFEKSNKKIIEEVKLIFSLKKVAQAKSEEVGAQYNESLVNVGQSYKEIAWINALTLGIEPLPQ